MEMLCFFAGIAFYYQKSLYPLYFLLSILFLRPKLVFVSWFFAAFLWCMFHQWLIADKGLPTNINLLNNAKLMGYIASIPTKSSSKTQFLFAVKYLNDNPVKMNILLSCYKKCPDVHAGEQWLLQAKIKKPLNLANPGGFDYVSWLGSRHIFWVGTIKSQNYALLTAASGQYFLLELREKFAMKLQHLILHEEMLGIFEALTIGLTNHIDKSQWDLFRRTGTTHLIDISGEHIALIAGISYGLLKWLWKRLGHLCLRYPAPKVASAGAIIISFLYALIAGFAVPTQRSLIMCSVMLLRNFRNHTMSIWQSWCFALLLVLVFEPHSVYMLGFYFSFIAVAILISINQRMRLDKISKMLIMQIACLIGLMPLCLYWFSYGSLTGLIANLFAIPWVSFLIVPLALLITFLSPWCVIPGSIPLVKWLIAHFLYCLKFIDSFDVLNFNFTFTSGLSPLALMIAMGLLIFLPLKKFFPAISILLLASFFPHYENINVGDAKIDILDVGQGLAIIARTANHTIIYDTGMKFYQGSDMGKLAIIPYLNLLGIKKLDKIIISHPDLDHRGGLSSIEEKYPVEELIVNEPNFYKRGVSCHNHPSWQWDGITFRFFSISKRLQGKNNNSCILQISNTTEQILLSGDIEKIAENYLIDKYGKQMKSTILLIPHHGSKTSSSRKFIEHISPQYAIASYGFDNRYHFPHQQALDAYQSLGIQLFNTVDCGMVRLSLKFGHLKPRCYRQQKRIN